MPLYIPVHGPTHNPGASDDLYPLFGNIPTARCQSMLLEGAVNSIGAQVIGTCYFSYFTAHASYTATTLVTWIGSSASANLTTGLLGLYTVAANGDIALVAQTNNDTAMGNTPNTPYTGAITKDGAGGAIANYAIARGQRYAIGVQQYGTASPAFSSLRGFTATAGLVALPGGLLRSRSFAAANAALVTSKTDAQLATSASVFFVAVY